MLLRRGIDADMVTLVALGTVYYGLLTFDTRDRNGATSGRAKTTQVLSFLLSVRS
jgi:hypothetical protein